MTKVGDRVELLDCSDPYTKLEPGALGTVSLVDSLGTVHVQWDSGSNLGLIPGHDSWRVVDDRGGRIAGAGVPTPVDDRAADESEALMLETPDHMSTQPETGWDREVGGAVGADGEVYSDADPGL